MDFKALERQISGTALAALAPFLQASFLAGITHGDHRRWQQLVASLPPLAPTEIELGATIKIGHAAAGDHTTREFVRHQLQQLIPWRKGPFSLFGIHIDSEWQSQMKWDRLGPAIEPLAGRTVLDVGSGNGYLSLRMCGEGARLVIGLEPHIPYYGQFAAIKHFIPEVPVFVLPVALERLPLPLPAFDTVFSLGVIYHQRSPLDHLLQLANCLKPGGQLVIESIVVDGEAGYSLLPAQRYARMGNVWLLPTIATLLVWLQRCGFVNARLLDVSQTSQQEQRRTEWMPFASLADALHPQDCSKTVEGYPAPQRALLLAEKAGGG